MKTIQGKLLVWGCILVIICGGGFCNIHRTLSGNTKHHRPRVTFPDELIEEIEDDDDRWGFFDHIFQKSNLAWFCSIPAAILVGSTGVLPLLIFTASNCPAGGALSDAISPSKLKLLLSFSVGGLFGDVFLHLLPESWMYIDRNDHYSGPKVGMWIIAGLICFLLIEKIFAIHEKMNEESSLKMEFEDHPSQESVDQGSTQDSPRLNKASFDSELIQRKGKSDNDNILDNKEITVVKNVQVHRDSDQGKRIMGYLNLLANCIDNFTHGLAVSGSFVVSIPVGVCTTFAILLHEIPHEIGDFAILLRAGFSRWDAAKGQVLTASGALFGCVFGLLAESAGDASSWVLPFTSGGFIYISCVTILPDLVQETCLVQSLKQMVALFMGIGVMALVSFAH